jgi:hypothetical protein
VAGRSSKPDGDDDDGFPAKEFPTAITVRSLLAVQPLPSLEEGEPQEIGAETALNPVPSSTWRVAGAALPDFMHVYLEVVGGTEPKRFDVTMTRTVLGRAEFADVRIDDAKVSRTHACILFVNNEFRIRDEGSGNGTLLNGSKVVEYALRDGDKLLMGETLLKFCVETKRAR